MILFNFKYKLKNLSGSPPSRGWQLGLIYLG
jgi:hypothetical protein